MKKMFLIILIATVLFSCDESNVNVGDLSDIKKPLPENTSLLIFRDALSFEYKFRMESDEKYPQDYNYKISNLTIVDGENITIEMNELRGYENEEWDGSSESTADAVINLGFLYRDEYNLRIIRENSGEFNAKMIFSDDKIKFEINEEQPFIYIKHNETKFLPENHFWGFIIFDKNTDYDYQKYIDELQTAGAEFSTLEEGFYSYFEINEEGEFKNPTIDNVNNTTYYYYFAYNEANLDAIKTVVDNYKNKSIDVLNITADGNFFPVDE